MLSRAAERVYWCGRYLERAEGSARVVQQYLHMLLDLPDEAGVRWQELAPIFGAGMVGDLDDDDEKTGFVDLMLAGKNSQVSLLNSLKMARENIRNTRDLLPIESWEYVNELYHYAHKSLDTDAQREDQFEVLSECIGRCHQLTGCLGNTMSHRSPYQFLMLGQQIERADMTTRIIDIAVTYLRSSDKQAQRFAPTLWTNLLKTVGGFQMYRQYVQPQVSGHEIINFLANDPDFPRAVRCAVNRAVACARALPRSDKAIAQLNKTRKFIRKSDVRSIDTDQISRLMDVTQKNLGLAHNAIAATWFLNTTSS